MSEQQHDPLLPPVEAARQLDVKVGTLEVWRATKRYKLPYVKIGGKVRYRQSAINAFIESRTVVA